MHAATVLLAINAAIARLASAAALPANDSPTSISRSSHSIRSFDAVQNSTLSPASFKAARQRSTPLRDIMRRDDDDDTDNDNDDDNDNDNDDDTDTDNDNDDDDDDDDECWDDGENQWVCTTSAPPLPPSVTSTVITPAPTSLPTTTATTTSPSNPIPTHDDDDEDTDNDSDDDTDDDDDDDCWDDGNDRWDQDCLATSSAPAWPSQTPAPSVTTSTTPSVPGESATTTSSPTSTIPTGAAARLGDDGNGMLGAAAAAAVVGLLAL